MIVKNKKPPIKHIPAITNRSISNIADNTSIPKRTAKQVTRYLIISMESSIYLQSI